jgi:6-pyruvoyltetrahydropterin/6-carboxytetrahydropterin synthase
MKIAIGKYFEFEASHKLPNREVSGKCNDLHGHSYKLEVEICGEINEYGWICNYSELKKIINDSVIKKYDHTYINDFMNVPTAENILIDIYNILTKEFSNKNYKLKRLKLYETSSSYAEITEIL